MTNFYPFCVTDATTNNPVPAGSAVFLDQQSEYIPSSYLRYGGEYGQCWYIVGTDYNIPEDALVYVSAPGYYTSLVDMRGGFTAYLPPEGPGFAVALDPVPPSGDGGGGGWT